MLKKYNSQGQKAYQRNDNEDRSLVYRNWLRTVKTGGFFLDIDFVKWKKVGEDLIPCAITELTRCDSEQVVGDAYLDAITKRLFVRDQQGKTIETLAKILKIPVYLVLFQKNMAWLKVYSFRSKVWRDFSLVEWAEFLEKL